MGVTFDIEALYATGYALYAAERHSDAARVFRIMLQAAPRDERAWLGLGACHEKVEQLLLALELYAAGHVAATRSARCVFALAAVLAKLGRDDEAARALDVAESRAEASDDEEVLEWVVAARRHAS